METLGIENLKKLIGFGLKLSKQASEILEDNKVSTTEVFSLLPSLMGIPDIVKSWPAVKAEFKDLSPDERVQLNDFFASEFDIKNDKMELFIEEALRNAVSLLSLVDQWKALKN